MDEHERLTMFVLGWIIGVGMMLAALAFFFLVMPVP